MNFNTKTGDLSKLRGACLVLGVHGKKRLSEAARSIDAASLGH